MGSNPTLSASKYERALAGPFVFTRRGCVDEPSGFDGAAAGGEERAANEGERAAALRGEREARVIPPSPPVNTKGPKRALFLSAGEVCAAEATGVSRLLEFVTEAKAEYVEYGVRIEIDRTADLFAVNTGQLLDLVVTEKFHCGIPVQM